MKKTIWMAALLICTVLFSAATTHRYFTVYMIYDGTGDESDYRNYIQSMQWPGIHSGSEELWWFRAKSYTFSINQWDFEAAFDELDSNEDNRLSDEAEMPSRLEFRNKF